MMRRSIITIAVILVAVLAGNAQNVKKARKGIIVVKTDSIVRAMEPYGGCSDDGAAYARAVNEFKRRYSQANVYCMIIPNAVAIYCPDSVSSWTADEQTYINRFYSKLDDDIKGIQLIDTLNNHRDEYIYLRTDHHWAPLGAYYAARTFAQSAEVPFKSLEDYTPQVIRHFVGTMLKFSGEKSLSNYPEDFVYYIPNDVNYEATQIKYYNRTYRKRRRRYTVLTAKPKENVSFFRSYDDGSAAAYSTFMGGDLNTTMVTTDTNNGRRLLILKDSYGNALPPFLFASFEEIHVVDCRYFLGNIITYAKDHQITDVLFANNLIHASTPAISQNYMRYMTQSR